MADYDFDTQAASIAQQKMVAERLRKKAESSNMPQGQMVSGHYVAPSWTQYLAPLVHQYEAGAAEKALGSQQQEYAGGLSKARQKWMESTPQAIPGTELPGPRAEGGSPELDAIAQPVTTPQILKHTMSGLAIPGNEKSAELYSKGALGEQAREDTQQFKKEDRETLLRTEMLKHRESLEAKQNELMLRLQDRGLDRASREQIAGLLRQTQLQIATMHEAGLAQGRNDAKNKLSEKARGEIAAFDASKKALTEGVRELDSSEGGKGMGWWYGLLADKIPGGETLVAQRRSQAANEALQKISFVTDEIRHGRFGSALTVSEKSSAAQYLPSQYDDKAMKIWKANGILHLMELNNARLKYTGGAPMEDYSGLPVNVPSTYDAPKPGSGKTGAKLPAKSVLTNTAPKPPPRNADGSVDFSNW